MTDADRAAAEELRAALADISGFWHTPGDLSPICVAMARHRETVERQQLAVMGQATLGNSLGGLAPAGREVSVGRREVAERRKGQGLGYRARTSI
ncbi:hypothetical protein [Novosphingobium sp. 9U]|uniref:hypothetical protein n=1 Tax=Novosphingobium sp. 9U TaxID=2653158 RepID=UPI00135AE0FF|nr:hypothetical protein [Novosphingobium sp. 9U]